MKKKHFLCKTSFELQGEGTLKSAECDVNVHLHITQMYVYFFKSVCENEIHGN